MLLSRWRTIVNLLLVLSLHRYIGLLLWLLDDSSSTLGGRLATALGWGRLVVFILLLFLCLLPPLLHRHPLLFFFIRHLRLFLLLLRLVLLLAFRLGL